MTTFMSIINRFQFKDFLAAMITVGFFGLLFILLHADVPSSTRDILMAMTGVCGTVFTYVAGFYYGSSVNHRQAGGLAEAPTQTVSVPTLPEPAPSTPSDTDVDEVKNGTPENSQGS